MIINKY